MDDKDQLGPDAMAAVVAHGLLTPASAIKMTADLLETRWDRIDPADREDLLRRISENAAFLTEMLKDIARGLPPGVGNLLDELDAESQRRRDERSAPRRP